MAVFVTFVLLLYIRFRKEPEIKSTSFTLSLLMFAGCYFNLLYLSLLIYFDHHAININTPHQNMICNLLLWFSAPGISIILMLAVLFVKMLRVCHIFTDIKLRLGRHCSDLSLASYVLLILTPNILVNLVRTFTDYYHISLDYTTQNGYVHVKQECSSKYETAWSGGLCAYLLMFFLALVVLAVKTRKVRLQHFKDTKKVNILLFILCLCTILTFSFWSLLQKLNSKPFILSIPLHIGHSVLILSFQIFLFVPKVFPPLWRRITSIVEVKEPWQHVHVCMRACS